MNNLGSKKPPQRQRVFQPMQSVHVHVPLTNNERDILEDFCRNNGYRSVKDFVTQVVREAISNNNPVLSRLKDLEERISELEKRSRSYE